VSVELPEYYPPVGEEHVQAPPVAWMHEAGNHVAISRQRRDSRLRVCEHFATGAVVLVVDRNCEQFEPDAIEIDSDDVLPRDDRDEFAVVALDEFEVASLKEVVRDVGEPSDGLGIDPALHVVFEGCTGGAVECREARCVSTGSERAMVHPTTRTSRATSLSR